MISESRIAALESKLELLEAQLYLLETRLQAMEARPVAMPTWRPPPWEREPRVNFDAGLDETTRYPR